MKCLDFDWHINEFMVYCRSTQLREKSMASYEQALRRWLQFKDRYVESDFLFPVKEHGGSIGVGNFENNFKKYIKRSDLNEEYTPHCLRNNFAKRCLMNGMDVFTLSKILGHSSVEVTEKAYLDLNDDDISKQYQRSSPLSFF